MLIIPEDAFWGILVHFELMYLFNFLHSKCLTDPGRSPSKFTCYETQGCSIYVFGSGGFP